MLSVVQAVSAQSIGTATSIATPSFSSTSGNLLVANGATDGGASGFPATAFSDSVSNFWAPAVPAFNAGTSAGTIQQYAPNINGSATHKVTLAFGPLNFLAIAVVEISGANRSAPFDQPASTGATSTNPHASGNTLTTAQADEICVGGGTHFDSNNNTFSSNNGYTVQTAQTNTTNVPIFLSTLIVSATGAQAESYNLTPNNSTAATCMVGTYKAALPATTPLTAYLTSTTDGLLATAKKVVTVAPATETSVTTRVNKLTGWVELWTLGNATSPGALGGSEPTPSGQGSLYDTASLEQCSILAGTWTPHVKLSVSSGLTAAIHVRAYKRSATGVYTLIGDWTTAATAISTSAAVFNPTATSVAAVIFASGDKLYIDYVLNITVAGGSTTGTVSLFEHGGANTSLVTPGSAALLPHAPFTRLQAVNRSNTY